MRPITGLVYGIALGLGALSLSAGTASARGEGGHGGHSGSARIDSQPDRPPGPVGIPVIYRGTYSCNQGPTALRLVLTRLDDGSFDAVFKFGPVPINPTIPRGSFRMKGAAPDEAGNFVLRPIEWIQRPRGFVMVGLSGVLEGGHFSGRVTGGLNCTSFDVIQGAGRSN